MIEVMVEVMLQGMLQGMIQVMIQVSEGVNFVKYNHWDKPKTE